MRSQRIGVEAESGMAVPGVTPRCMALGNLDPSNPGSESTSWCRGRAFAVQLGPSRPFAFEALDLEPQRRPTGKISGHGPGTGASVFVVLHRQS